MDISPPHPIDQSATTPATGGNDRNAGASNVSIFPEAVRRALVLAFIAVWVTTQVTIPFIKKFDPPSFRYRHGRYSWSMFSRLVPRGEIRLFRLRNDDSPEAIPQIKRYRQELKSPDPMPTRGYFFDYDEIEARFAALITAIAQQQHDGYTYVVTIDWKNVPGRTHWQFQVPAPGKVSNGDRP